MPRLSRTVHPTTVEAWQHIHLEDRLPLLQLGDSQLRASASSRNPLNRSSDHSMYSPLNAIGPPTARPAMTAPGLPSSSASDYLIVPSVPWNWNSLFWWKELSVLEGGLELGHV